MSGRGRGVLLVAGLALALGAAGPARAKKPRGKVKVKRAPLSRACEEVKRVEHGLDLLSAPLATEGTKPRALPMRNYSELAFVTDEWLAFREVDAPSEILVMNVDGGEALPVSPPGLFCGGLERTGFEDGVRFHCRPRDAGPEKRRFYVARPPGWKAESDDGKGWSHALRAADAEAFARRGFSSHDVFRTPVGLTVAVPRSGFGGGGPPHSFLAEARGRRGLWAIAEAAGRRVHYPASFREAPRVAISLDAAGHALHVLDLEKKQTLCASPRGTSPITAYLGASKNTVLFLRGRLPIWSRLEVHLADLETGVDHHLGTIPVKSNALVKVLPEDRFLLVLLPEKPPRTFQAHFLLVDGRSLEIRKLSEPVGNILHNLYGVEASPGGSWLRFRDGRSHPWTLPIPRRRPAGQP